MVNHMIFVGIVLAVSLGTAQTSPVPAKVLAKYVLSLQPSPSLGGVDGLDEPHDLDIANGLESAESVYEPVRYRRPAFQEDPYYSAHHQEQLQQQYHQLQQQQHQYDDQEPEDEPDYGEASDSETASANHAYMTTYKTATRHGGGRGYYGSSYGDNAEDEDTSASEESPAVYEPIRAHKGKGKGKKQGSGGGAGSSSYSHNHHYYTHHHQQQQQSPQKGSGHTSYHPQLIQAYKILHGTGGRLPTSHEYEDDRGSEEHRHYHVEDDDDDDDEDFRSGAAIGAAAGATGYGGAPTGPQVIHTKGRAVPISQHVEIETPIPVPYVKKIHVPIPQEVKVRIPHPVLVPIPRPYPVHIPVSQPVAVPDIKEITVPIEKIVPYPVEKKIPVPIEKPVPYPIEKHVPVYLPQPIAVRVPIVKTIIHKVKQQTASGPTLPPAGGSFW